MNRLLTYALIGVVGYFLYRRYVAPPYPLLTNEQIAEGVDFSTTEDIYDV